MDEYVLLKALKEIQLAEDREFSCIVALKLKEIFPFKIHMK
jgi:hypothetical protein